MSIKDWFSSLFQKKTVSTYSGPRCSKCGKALQEMSMGFYLGSDIISAVGSSPYPCKSCGTPYCVDCMARLRIRGVCPRCSGSLGW